MLVILIKDQFNKVGYYQTCSFNEKLEKEVASKPDDTKLLTKHIAKEFEITPDVIFKYWIVNYN